MPRPKRSKLAPPVPTASIPTGTLKPNPIPKQVFPVSTLARDSSNSDDSEGLVKKSKTTPKDSGKALQDAYMSGALPVEDGAGLTRLKPLGGRQRAALSKVAREADHAKAIEALKRRRDEALAKEKQAIMQDHVLVPSSMPKSVEELEAQTVEEELIPRSAIVGRIQKVPFSSRKVQATPGKESSISALGNFKRRPRKPSILQIGRQDDTASTIEINDEVEDFRPDDESTPFNLTKTQSFVRATPSPQSSPPSQVHSSNPRKRKLTPPAVQVPRSESPISQVSSSPPSLSDLPSQNTIATVINTPEDDTEPTLPPSNLHREATPEIWSDTMAAPHSSSPFRISPPKPSKPPANSTSKGPRKPPTRSTFTATKPKSLNPLSTATLQTLLPRRRLHRSRANQTHTNGDTSFDIPSSRSSTPTPAEDEDELSFAAPTTSKRKKTAHRLVLIPVKKDNAKRKPKRGAATTLAPNGKLRSKPVAEKGEQTEGVVRTYSRCVADKENVPVSDSETSSEGEGEEESNLGPVKGQSKGVDELKTLAKKFAEVDQWEMEFEVVTASSSSPRDGR